jgi:hypothetical protein
MEKEINNALGSKKEEANNLKIVISNYYPSFSDEFTVLVNEVSHTVKTSGLIPSMGYLISTLEPGFNKIRIQQTKSLMGFMNNETIQEFELEFKNDEYFLIEYKLNQANQSSHTIAKVSEPFENPDKENIIPQNHEPSTGVKLATKINTLARTIGSGAGKIRNAISFKKKN